MGIQVVGNSGIIAEVESARRTVRTTLNDIDYGTLGIYSMAAQTGVMAAGLAANSEIYQFRWTNSTNLCLIKSVSISAGGIAAFTAGVASFNLFVARSWSVDGSGGTTLTPGTGVQKLRQTMGDSLVGSVRIASTAALTAGTKTLDTNAHGSVTTSVTATAGDKIVPGADLWENLPGMMPIVLASNEGFVVRATVPATGTWTASVTVTWAEISSY